MSAQKHVFSFITQNALILNPINVLKLNITYFGTKDMSVSITVLEIQHIGAYIDSRKRGISDSGGNNRSLCDESTKFCMKFCHLISQYESVSQVKVATYDVRHHEQSN